MSDASKMPDLALFQWSTPDSPNPRLASPLSATGTTIYVTAPPLDEDGNIIAKAFLMGVKSNGYTETIYVPANAVDGYGNVPTTANPGTTITGATRGIDLAGLDYTTGNTELATSHSTDSPIFSNVAAFHFESMRSALQGDIASGGENWRIGAETDNDITIYAANGDGSEPFWRYDASENKWVYSNDGVSSTPFGTGAGVTGGDGISVTSGDIDVDLTDTSIFKAVSAGAGDASKAVLFDADGYIDQDSVQLIKDVTSTAAEINKLDGASANVTAANLNTLTAGISSPIATLHAHKRTFGTTTKSVAATSDTQNITHNLGTTPNWIKIKAVRTGSVGYPTFSDGIFDGTSYATMYTGTIAGGGGASAVSSSVSSSGILYIKFNVSYDNYTISATATLTSTEIQLSYTNSYSSAVSIALTWEAGI